MCRPSPFRRSACIIVALAFAGPLARAVPASRQLEYQIKAGYLYNFAKFVEWPPPPLAAGGVFRLGVLGDESAYSIIAEALRGRKIGEHPIQVVLLASDAAAASCRVVFIPRSVQTTVSQLRAELGHAAVLLVGEKDGFAAAGGEIGFVPRGENLRYQVNLAAAEQAGLHLSARLAGLAEIVHPAAL